MLSISARIAQDLSVREAQVIATMELLDGGATVPFVARYRKEATGGLDDTQLRTLDERLRYLRDLEDRRETVLKSIEEQGKLSDALKTEIQEADTKTRLEDIYLPYKPKRRTKAQIARENGLEPLADTLFGDPSLVPEEAATAYLSEAVPDAPAALEGAKQILMERFAETADLVGGLRETYWTEGQMTAKVVEGEEEKGAKFSDYFDHREPIAKIPSHRALAMFRGREEGVLRLALVHPNDPENPRDASPAERRIAYHFGLENKGRPADKWLADVARWTWRVKLGLHIEMDLMGRLRTEAEDEAIRVFANNLNDLLMAAPAGARPTLALDPGYRTGVKVAVVDATGKLVDTGTIFPHEPRRQWEDSLNTLEGLCRKHGVELISIGNGTASRETDQLAGDLIKRAKDLRLTKVTVSEAGASVYSASEFASKEFPDLDVSIRGAVSIGRRLQDPMAELVKIDPKSIGVGQYQHDVSPVKLDRALDGVVEDAVNAVGVDLNMASAPLLARVSGLSETQARNIVAHRDENGAFARRKDLLKVGGLGPKTFEQAAGFLRIRDGSEPLDASSVHPEAYPVVQRILKAAKSDIREMIGNVTLISGLRASDFTDETFGLPTIQDILKELEKPGRDPRPEFKTATFMEGVEKISHLRPGMILEGTVTNVANFGAFVDIGVHQDGLVHVSALADRFVKDPREVVKTGDVVTVKVLEVDLKRNRIALTRRLSDTPESKGERSPSSPRPASPRPASPGKGPMSGKGGTFSGPRSGGSSGGGGSGAFADAFAKAGLKPKGR
ncbi:MAG: RNA-binding transcriptional accessory protein [Rhodospirillum sp.]|nr:RNA-binding transcriptional accessory protein [Rhodospirillum sp.]MCF8487918.1 RNA-binding transcriptional accessory protein [Rhodospirillum sp.]MCF8500681.1 RNA-binding transcriptional accessory protein [Rhodospirillum sp.]